MIVHPTHPMSRLSKVTAALLVGVALACAPTGSFAQDAPANTAAPADATQAPGNAAQAAGQAGAAVDPNAVVATVGTDSITEADLAFAAEDLGQELQSVPPADQRAFLVTILIDMKVMANAAREAQMDQTELFKQRLEYLQERALRRAYLAEKISGAVTPEAVQVAYDAYVQGFQPQEEVHAHHILVSSQDDANAIKAELDAGGSFEDLAKQKSIDPSAAQNGGDLGFFSKGMMVPEFEAAAFTMQPNQVSAPIQSQFGWHIIRLDEKRMSSPPTLQQVGPQLQQQLLFTSFDQTVADLKSKTAINIPDAALATAVSQQNEASAQGAAPPPAP